MPGPGVSLGTQVTRPPHLSLRCLPVRDGSLLSSARDLLPQPRGPPAGTRLYLTPTILALTGFLKELEQDMSRHKEQRQQAALTEHLLRMETQPVLTELPLLPGRSMAGDSSPIVTPRQSKETSHEPTSLPQASCATKKLCRLVSSVPQSTVQTRKGARAAAAPKASLAGAPSTTKTMTRRIKK